jgi:hypothetical protein
MKGFIDLYERLNLISKTGEGFPLHRMCSNREECWKNALDRIPPDHNDWSQISKPWRGPRYEELRLVAIGENLNEYGGLNALAELTEEAKDLILDGYRRVRFHAAFDEYAGSFLWHRLGCYSAAIGESLGVMTPKWGTDGYPEPKDVAVAIDWIAFTEHVKCAPLGGKPTPAMWEHCGTHILREELSLLEPKHILVLGQSNNAWFLSKHVFASNWKDEKKIGSVTMAKGELHGKPVVVWIVPHPQSYGGTAKSILDDLRKVLHLTKITQPPT